jgi:hypothetical protein
MGGIVLTNIRLIAHEIDMVMFDRKEGGAISTLFYFEAMNCISTLFIYEALRTQTREMR